MKARNAILSYGAEFIPKLEQSLIVFNGGTRLKTSQEIPESDEKVQATGDMFWIF